MSHYSRRLEWVQVPSSVYRVHEFKVGLLKSINKQLEPHVGNTAISPLLTRGLATPALMEHGALARVAAPGVRMTGRRAGSSGSSGFSGLPPKFYWLVSHFLFQHTLTINITLPISYIREALAEVHRWIRVCILSGTQFRWERPAQHCLYIVAAFWRIDRALPVGRVCKGFLHGILARTHGYNQWKLGGQGSLLELGVITCVLTTPEVE